MANNYSESSSMIDCSKEVAIEAVTVLERIEQWVDDERFQRTETPDAFVAYCLASGFSLTEAQKRLVAHPDFVEEILCELDEGFADLGFNAVSEERGIWLSGGEYFNELKASGFAAAVMSAYGVGGTTLISTAHYCSKARLNEFGGNSIFVNKNGRHFDNQFDLESAVKAAEHEKYYLATFSEQVAGFEFDTQFVMKVAEGRDVDQDALKLLKDWRGEMSEVDEENVRGIACGGQVHIALDGLVEITPADFAVMSKHLAVLSGGE